MGWLSTIGAGFEVAKQVMGRLWGDQTSEQAQLQKEAEDVRHKKQLAMTKVRNAENIDQLKLALDELNYWDARLHELHTHALAKWG